MKNFLRVASLSVLVLAALASGVWAQGRGPTAIFGGGGEAGMLMLLGNEDVAKELDLVEDQQEKLRALGEKTRTVMREMFQGVGRDASEEERRAAFEGMREKIAEHMKKTQEEVNQILLPNQLDRLKQIQFQMQARGFGGGGGSGVSSSRVAEELGLSETQREALRTKAEAIRAETEKKIAELRQDAEKQLLEELTPEQREKYQKLMGERFELPPGGFFPRGTGGDGPREGGFRNRSERNSEG